MGAQMEANIKRYNEIGVEMMSLACTRWCTLHLKCTINVHLFFTVHVPVEQTRLANIYDRIASRHGNSISDLTMYKGSVLESHTSSAHAHHGGARVPRNARRRPSDVP